MQKMSSSPDNEVPSYRYTSAADRDIEAILRYTAIRFGPRQRQRYAALLDKAASMIAADPMRHGARPRDEVTAGLRSFHMQWAGPRLRAAAHVLYYVHGVLGDGVEAVIILRVLHERMDPTRHIGQEPQS